MAEPQHTTPTKICSKCHIEKPLTDFSPARDYRLGCRGVCRVCENVQRHDPAVWARRRERLRLAGRKREPGQASKPGRARSVDPVKRRARDKVRRAVAAGKIVRPDTCPECGVRHAKLDAHHIDYARPLDVEWLCKMCHAARHSVPLPEITDEASRHPGDYCRNGHLLTAGRGYYVEKNGHRRCRECARLKHQRERARLKAGRSVKE